MGILSRIRKGGSMSKCQLCSKEVVEWINNNPKSPEQIEETKEYL